ncbi:MAG: NAD(P)/FAD-dependent oxidoreductase [Colwellia sp.]|uniref:NAD(P)/FAD-dependent oxidoreductase n=1 Tax=Colwellia sp. TaxID=56799 RepID=UPI0025BD1C75|nr:NAD(P)/FAD-dependent oxidoreductase [Colwellia sp.]NQZ27802.1 NAD(P)/FAD-dependent oxidoreductase [Colwellia sp.]
MINSQSIMPKYDVAIIGAGWSGLALARQLKRNNRDIRIIQLEVSTEFKAKIGEATVENTGHYFLKKLGLANYLYRNQLPKNALRFFFDNEDHSLPIEQMSEQGTTYIPPHPAFQLDRASFESALTDMNREDDITVLQGAKVTGFELDHHNEHTVKFNYQNEAHQIRCKWLVDASGRAGVVARRMKSYSRENVPSHSSAWGRFSGVKDFDSVGTQKWRDGASSRFLSTNHFSGHGYWIWFIPLKNGLTSIGIVCDKTKVNNPPMKQADFIAKLKEHTAIADLIEDAKIEDFEAWGQLAYRGKGIVNRERWGATGFAAMFLDPLLSGGGDVIAMANDNLTKLILADLGNPDREAAQMALDEAVPYANEVVDYYYQFLYAQLMNLYPVLECAELCSPVMAYINATYFITSAWDYMAGNFSDYDHFSKNDFIRRGNYGLEMLMQRQILEALAILQNENRAFVRNNEGFFETGADLYKYYIYQMGEKGKDGYRIDLRVKLFTECFAIVTGSKLGLPKFGRRRIVQNALNLPMILQKPTFGRDQLPELLITMSHNLTQELQQTTEHTVLVKITEASFRDEMVEVTIVDNTADADQLKKIKKTANGIWMHQQEYIEQTSFVSVFLQYARQQPLDIMDPSHPVRLEASEMCEA